MGSYHSYLPQSFQFQINNCDENDSKQVNPYVPAPISDYLIADDSIVNKKIAKLVSLLKNETINLALWIERPMTIQESHSILFTRKSCPNLHIFASALCQFTFKPCNQYPINQSNMTINLHNFWPKYASRSRSVFPQYIGWAASNWYESRKIACFEDLIGDKFPFYCKEILVDTSEENYLFKSRKHQSDTECNDDRCNREIYLDPNTIDIDPMNRGKKKKCDYVQLCFIFEMISVSNDNKMCQMIHDRLMWEWIVLRNGKLWSNIAKDVQIMITRFLYQVDDGTCTMSESEATQSDINGDKSDDVRLKSRYDIKSPYLLLFLLIRNRGIYLQGASKISWYQYDDSENHVPLA